MKTEIYNLIILDESGSMSHVKRQTVSGCNETINTIRSAQEKFADTQTHYVSIYAFQANDKIPSRYLIKNRIDDPQGLKDFCWEGFKLDESRSTDNHWLFTLES